MILDRIILNNFGAYGGQQEAQLSPEKDRPVLLFGGMNGGGKTTMLDALQLVLYGKKAKLSNRGRKAYHSYLEECIHRGTPLSEGAGITLCFRRIVEGKTRHFELQRTWHLDEGKLIEDLRVYQDEELDAIFTEHWDEVMEAYLPVAISNLFFFDGEQIKELAEGKNAAAILGSAIRSLLGLDLVDRLEDDLKVFERRKKGEGISSEAAKRLKLAEAEHEEICKQEAQLRQDEGRLNNIIDKLGENVKKAENEFKNLGGELYLEREQIETELNDLTKHKHAINDQLRELASGPLPLHLIGPLLNEVCEQAEHETKIRHSSLLIESLNERDQFILELLNTEKLSKAALTRIKEELEKDRLARAELSHESPILDVDENLSPHIKHLKSKVFPEILAEKDSLLSALCSTEEKIARLEAQLGRVPDEDSIAKSQKNLDDAREAYASKTTELQTLELRLTSLERQGNEIKERIKKLIDQDQDELNAEDSRLRMLKHSEKVRNTLSKFKTTVIQRHVSNMEALMLESFQKLLRKHKLVKGLHICPENFEVTLKDQNNDVLPFERLSAGERQLLATAMLWGLARASGRPIPTVIDTPLGRLDSTHRKHVVGRYFPHASHQVILLSTDEEIVGPYHKTLKPHIAREQLLAHDEKTGKTHIQEGYFSTHEATR